MTLLCEDSIIPVIVALCARVLVSLYVLLDPPVTRAISVGYILPLPAAVPLGLVLVGCVRSLHAA